MRTTQEQINKFHKRFNKSINDFPTTTIATIRKDGTIIKEIEIDTKEIFINGDWLSRQLPGISFKLLKKYLKKNGHLSGIYGEILIGTK